LSFSPAGQAFKSLPAIVTGGAISHFHNGESLAFHLDSASGAALTGSISQVDGTGQATGFTVTIPSGTSISDSASHSVVAVGTAGSVATSNPFAYDTVAPSVSVTFPTSNANYNPAGWTGGGTAPCGSSGTICGQATDATSGISGSSAITLTITQSSGSKTWNGNAFATGTNTVHPGSYALATGLWTYTFSSSSFLPDGTYSVAVVAVDKAGNAQVTPATKTFLIDTVAPSPTIGTSTPPSYTKSATPTLSGTAGTQAADSGHTADGTTVAVKVYPGPDTTGTPVQTATPTVSSGSWTVPGSGLSSNGQYTVQVTQTDGAGNSSSPTKTFIIDNTAPNGFAAVVSATGSAPSFLKKSGTYVVYANATDPLAGGAASGIASMTANLTNLGGGATTALSTCSSGCTVGATTYAYVSAQQTASSSLSDGVKTFTITATDNATNSASSSSQNVTADSTAPTGLATKLSAAGDTTGGSVGSGRPYRVYANASDPVTGGVASGVGLVTANLTNLGGGSTVALTTCSSGCTVAGTAYSYATAQQTAGTLSGSTTTYTLTATDDANNSTTTGTQSVSVDNIAPTVTSLAINSGGTSGTIDAGDQIVITFSSQMNVASLCPTWNDDTVNQNLQTNGDVTVTVADNASNDTLSVSSATCTLNIGTVSLGADYVAGTSMFNGSGSNKSTVSWSANNRRLTITLGSVSSGSSKTGVAQSTMTFNPASGTTDTAGNPVSSSGVSAANQRF
jgi:hypothetical protein